MRLRATYHFLQSFTSNQTSLVWTTSTCSVQEPLQVRLRLGRAPSRSSRELLVIQQYWSNKLLVETPLPCALCLLYCFHRTYIEYYRKCEYCPLLIIFYPVLPLLQNGGIYPTLLLLVQKCPSPQNCTPVGEGSEV